MLSELNKIRSSLVMVSLLAVSLGSMPVDAQVPGPRVPDHYIVILHEDVADPAGVGRQHGVQVRHVYRKTLKGFAAVIPAARLPAVKADPRVRKVEQERIHYHTAQSLPTGIDRIEADLNPNSTGIVVNLDAAFIDTGIDAGHPDLNVAGGINFAGGPAYKWNDGNGHGTHVAGTVGAIDNDFGVVGVAPSARLWAVRVLKNGGIGFTGDIMAGIEWVAVRKADFKAGKPGGIDFAVANMSISTSDEDFTCGQGNAGGVHLAICGLVSEGVVFTLSAGNDRRVKKAYPEVLAVSALADFDGKAGGAGLPTCRSDQDDSLADFSNFGSEVDIAAPGVCILSTWKDAGYNTISGTSMSAPHVAGAVLLYLHVNGLSPAMDGAGVDAIEAAILNGGLAEGTANEPCSYDNERGLNEPLLFVNSGAFGGDGSCDVPNPPVCGDGTCNGDETCLSCEADCGLCPSCGDGACNGNETCLSCETDCGLCPSCGDGVCNGDETCETCSGDCGVCPECSQAGDSCDNDADCCSGKCKGKPGAKTCK